MSDLRPRSQLRRPVPTRHGRLRRRGPGRTLGTLLATSVGVIAVSALAVGGVAALDVKNSLNKSVDLLDAQGNEQKPPTVGAMDGSFNVLLAGSDSGGGNAAYGERGETLNDVTMLLHVSADHEHATIVSFPRDMFVPIPSCPKEGGGSYSAMSSQKINTTLTYGGLSCTVLTVEKLTGLDIPYAAMIEFDGVVEMSNAIGGVPVCVAGDIDDPYTGLVVKKGENTLQGTQALAFLRSRHGVGDGSDLGRISSQQVFMSSMVRTVRSSGTLGNPLKVYALAKAVARNMTLSSSLNDVGTMASMATALKSVNPDNVVFVQYPNHYVSGGVAPTTDAASSLFAALASDKPITLTGTTGIGAESAAAGSGGADAPGAGSGAPEGSSGSDGAGASESGTPEAGDAVSLPSTVTGQTAGQQTCTKPFSG